MSFRIWLLFGPEAFVQLRHLAVEAHRRHSCELVVVHRIECDDHPHAVAGRKEFDEHRAFVRLHVGQKIHDVRERKSLVGFSSENRACASCEIGRPICVIAAIASGVAAIMS
jgi:hypothetical protein